MAKQIFYFLLMANALKPPPAYSAIKKKNSGFLEGKNIFFNSRGNKGFTPPLELNASIEKKSAKFC